MHIDIAETTHRRLWLIRVVGGHRTLDDVIAELVEDHLEQNPHLVAILEDRDAGNKHSAQSSPEAGE